jgi:hypothetical protein
LLDDRFDADAPVDDQNAWLWFGVVNEAWCGLGRGRCMFEARPQ